MNRTPLQYNPSGSNNYGSSGSNMNMNGPSGSNMNMNGPSGSNMNMNGPSGQSMNMNGSSGSNMNMNGPSVCNANGFDQYGKQCTPPNTGLSSYLPKIWPFSGGRRRRTAKRGGGFRPYTDMDVASTASRFSGGQTAQPHQWTGGKRRRGLKKTRGTTSKRRSFKCNKCSKRIRHKH